MNSGYKKKPRLIRSHDDAAEMQQWQIRTIDGRIRGPVGLEGLKSLLEVGILSHTTKISGIEEESWAPIAAHPVWPRLQPQSKPLKLRNVEMMEDATDATSLAPTSPVSEERMLRMASMRKRELESSHRSLAWWQFGRALRMIRELFIFFGFLTAGDLGTSFFDVSAGLVKWGILLCLTCVAVMYYSVRAMDR